MTEFENNRLYRSARLAVINAVLEGHFYKLQSAFPWSETPEGHQYWSDVHQSGRLNDIARAKLEEMAEALKSQATDPHPLSPAQAPMEHEFDFHMNDVVEHIKTGQRVLVTGHAFVPKGCFNGVSVVARPLRVLCYSYKDFKKARRA